MGLKKSGFTEDLRTAYPKYNKAAFGSIIDEHVLMRIKGIQDFGEIILLKLVDDEKCNCQKIKCCRTDCHRHKHRMFEKAEKYPQMLSIYTIL